MNKDAPPTPKTRTKEPLLDTPMATNRAGTTIDIPDDDDLAILCATPPDNVISVEHYSDDDLDLQLTIMASLLPQTRRRRKKTGIIDLDDSTDDDDEFQFLYSSASFERTHSVIEPGESSNSPSTTVTVTFACEICTETKPFSESFTGMGCSHSYCSDCIVKYVCSKLDQNITHVPCPDSGCDKGVLDPDHCSRILPPDVFDRWGSALCESVILTSEKFYCPFKDCSALMIDDSGGNGGGGEGGEAIAEAECPNCNRLFCARCKVPWHPGIECSEYQKLNKDERGREDIMLMKLAKDKKWTRCPKCMIYVEKTEGCLFILCRCGHSFCYNCGAFMIQHYCDICKH